MLSHNVIVFFAILYIIVLIVFMINKEQIIKQVNDTFTLNNDKQLLNNQLFNYMIKMAFATLLFVMTIYILNKNDIEHIFSEVTKTI